MRTLAILALVTCGSSAASAQVIYQPAVTQYGGENRYQYVGDDSCGVAQAAAYPSLPGASWGRANGFAYVSSRRQVVEREPRLFIDYLGPHGNPITDLTPADLQNAANARVPRYFTKADAIADAERGGCDDVAADSRQPSRKGSIIIVSSHRSPTTHPATTRPTR